MNRIPGSHGRAIWLLAPWFFTCLFCQAYPETTQVHDAGGSDLDYRCLTVAEASPVSNFHVLVESTRNADQTYDLVLTALQSPPMVFGSVRPAFQRDRSSPKSVKLYQLDRVYRI